MDILESLYSRELIDNYFDNSWHINGTRLRKIKNSSKPKHKENVTKRNKRRISSRMRALNNKNNKK